MAGKKIILIPTPSYMMVLTIATYYYKRLLNNSQNTYRAIFQIYRLIKLGAKQFKYIPLPGTRTDLNYLLNLLTK